MAGVVDGLLLEQLHRGELEAGGFLLRVELHQVEAADQHVRRKPGLEVHHTPVAAAADDDAPFALADEQVHFVPEVIRFQLIAALDLHAVGVGEVHLGEVGAGVQAEGIGEGQVVTDKHDPLFAQQLPAEADVLLLGVVVIAKGMLADIDLRVVVDLQEALDAAAVVVMTVAEDAQIHLREVNAHLFGVVGESAGLARVKEDVLTVGLDVQAQAVLANEIVAAGGVFNQGV